MRTIDITPRPDSSAPRSQFFAVAALAVLFAFVGWRVASASSAAPAAGAANAAKGQSPSIAQRESELNAAERATIEVFRRVSPAVVHVTNVPRAARGRSLEDVVSGAGSGFVWDTDGHVVTNYHVVQRAVERGDLVYVRFAGDEAPYEARIVNVAPHRDIAVLKLVDRPATPLTPVELGQSTNLLVGQHVYAIGNPFGLDQTLSSGLVSGLDREIRSVTQHKIDGVIQTDAAINPGNSGGPLLDSRGRLIGVNTAIITLSGADNGIGFAVPVDTVRPIVDEIVATGHVTRPGLGVELLGDFEAARLGLVGVGVAVVQSGSAAQEAGLRSAEATRAGRVRIDEILEIDTRVIRSRRDLFDALDGRAVGETIKLKVRRGQELFETALKLQALQN